MEKNIHNKLFKLQLEIGSISKDVTNPFYKSKYFDINSLIGQLHPLLEKHGLLLLQPIENNEVKSIIIDLDGGSVESSINLPMIQDPQKLGSAITYFRRYTLQSLLALQAEDDDGNKASKAAAIKAFYKPKLFYKDATHKATKEFLNCQEAITKRGKTIDDIKEHYTIDKETENKLLNFKLN
tara:strand:- start:460 stop:1005 length:546 start_codon:yes stop_codon:yes gene_type:complete